MNTAQRRIAQINGVMPLTEDYNGWKNRETWNVALWIGNDRGLYLTAQDFKDEGYKAFAADLMGSEFGPKTTGDGVKWDDPKLDIPALDEFLRDL